MCDCHCASKNLYNSDFQQKQYQLQNGDIFTCKRDISKFYDPIISPHLYSYQQNLEMGEITYPVGGELERIQYQEIIENPLFFYKQFLSKNKACIIEGANEDWKAMELWCDIAYLREKITQEITVDITPDGFADSIHGDYFIQPYQEKMKFDKFLELKENNLKQNLVPYIQKQNNNLDQEFSFIRDDIGKDFIDFISESYFESKKPDAANFWMGYSDSVSAMHKDPYENFYSVIKGEKHFSLLPPDAYPFLGLRDNYIQSQWTFNQEKSHFKVSVPDLNEKVPWIGINIDLKEDRNNFSYIRDLPQYHVIVKPGEILYLPALWYHQVTQFSDNKDGPFIIAQNFWLDMEFDHKYRVFQFLQQLVSNETNKK